VRWEQAASSPPSHSRRRKGAEEASNIPFAGRGRLPSQNTEKWGKNIYTKTVAKLKARKH